MPLSSRRNIATVTCAWVSNCETLPVGYVTNTTNARPARGHVPASNGPATHRVGPFAFQPAGDTMQSSTSALPSTTGTVRWFDRHRGHGFIRCDPGGEDCFLHQSEILPADRSRFEEGTRVRFDIAIGLGGPYAVHIIVL